MKAESVLVYRLSNVAGVTGYIGTNPPRLYPLQVPQNVQPEYPYITYRVIDSRRIQGVYSDPGMAEVRLQLTFWSQDYTEAKALAEQARLALERYSSSPGGSLVNGVTLYDIYMGSEADSYEQPLEAFAIAVDYTIVHAE